MNHPAVSNLPPRRARWIRRLLLSLTAMAVPYAVLLTSPQIVFADEVRAENVVLHARSPLPARAAEIAAAAQKRVSRSPFYVPTDTYDVYLCDWIDSGPGRTRATSATGVVTLTISSLGTSDDEKAGDLDVIASMTIVGPGRSLLSVDANGKNRVFHVHPGIVVSIAGVTIRNGFRTNAGGILSEGKLTLNNVRVTGNVDDCGSVSC
jgi:hypothetical protein